MTFDYFRFIYNYIIIFLTLKSCRKKLPKNTQNDQHFRQNLSKP